KNDHVKPVARAFEIEPAIGVMDVYPRISIRTISIRTIFPKTIGTKRSRLRREELPRHVDERGIELHIVDPLDRRMLQDLNHAAVRAAADEQNLPRRRMLQQRVVNRFLGGSLVGHISQDHAVVIEAANIARLNDG